ncbi:A disintegrin and metalloproteinase with thrombospondin motifs 2-like isoform X2 [Linepithema humile]|uniref:A disintegrin and metalloproteinase with thrombospondin motifs 2-like isoform X2 n=1 Tax=Linepithema humile TaxID=83485 RepID=UPI00351DCDF6
MFLLLEFILIIILNKTNAYITQDSEIILLPSWNPTGEEEIQLTLKAFGKLVQLKLRKNDQIVSPTFEEWKYNANGVTEMSQLKALDFCFYLHKDHIGSAAINFCQDNGLEGLIFVENGTLEIRSLRSEFAPLSLIDDFCVKEEINLSFGKPHLIKTVQYFGDSNLHHWNNFKPKRRQVRNTQQKLTIDLAVFFDEAAYRIFMPLLDNNKEKIRYMILAHVNRIQAVFYHPSLGVTIDVSLNPPNDNDPHHWDIGLYLTGTDIYGYTEVPLFGIQKYLQLNSGLKGASIGNGVCDSLVSCAIVEFHASEVISLGLRSSSYAVHEIGHLLGLDHDTGSTYIMSEYDSTKTLMVWSPKSRNEIKGLWERKECLRDHTKPERRGDPYLFDSLIHYDLPGREWTAKAQCEVSLRDKDANVVTLHDICKYLQCETPHKNTYYFMGPALAGTHCALGMECRDGKCVPVIEPPYIFKYCEDDNWSEWKEDSCKSSCIKKFIGVLVKRRFCKHQNRRTANCIGPYYDALDQITKRGSVR